MFYSYWPEEVDDYYGNSPPSSYEERKRTFDNLWDVLDDYTAEEVLCNLEDEREAIAQLVDARLKSLRPKTRIRGQRIMPRAQIYAVDHVRLALQYPGREMHRSWRNHGRKPRERFDRKDRPYFMR